MDWLPLPDILLILMSVFLLVVGARATKDMYFGMTCIFSHSLICARRPLAKPCSNTVIAASRKQKKIAKFMGFSGARYPWQSSSSGREETPKGGWDPQKKIWHADFSHMQVHVNAAIAFNIWQYYQATGNLQFLYMYGGDVLLEIT